ncbi:PREDICTED: C-C motif chemokine 5-like, partial [Tauraco erythrolophus]|uniref:C-C motif chemokine 5-like n=1 Tax=Tauraco erythrolophus TaxID=121530 RepID=UPI000523AE15
PHTPLECCYGYTNSTIHLAKLRSFYRTPNECFMPAVVFETKKRKICANPKVTWVEKAVEYLEKKKGRHAP